MDAAERFLRRDPDRQSGLSSRLDRASIELSPAEYVTVLTVASAVLALFGFVILGVMGLFLFPFVGVFSVIAWVDLKGKRRTEKFTEQLDDTLQQMAGGLRAGFGIMQAIRTAAEESEWPTSEELSRVIAEVRIGRDLGESMQASAERIGSEDYDWTVQAIQISREVGGNLAEVLDNVGQTIRQRNTLRREVRALSAEGRMSGYILFALPFVMLAWMGITNSEYIGLLFSHSGGHVALIAGVALMTAAAFWMRKIVRIEF